MMISCRRVAGTRNACDSAWTLMPIGTRYSSRNISPGCTGRILLFTMLISLVATDDFPWHTNLGKKRRSKSP